MKRLFLLLALLSLLSLALPALPARADDQTREVQQALKDQGFYYGQVDGQGGPETDAAVRRYQIRQGLEVTGKLDQQTLASLNLGGRSDNSATVDNPPPPPPPAPADDNQPPKSVVQSDHDFLKNQPTAQAPAPSNSSDDDTANAQPPPPPPDNTAPQAPPPALSSTQGPAPDEDAQADYSQFFRKTPFEDAPPVVQRSTVQHAQMRLAHKGFFRGIADGQLSDTLSRSLADYQRYAELAPTGRLDMDTLADMNLLPRRRIFTAPPPPYGYYGDAPRDVYRGIWVH